MQGESAGHDVELVEVDDGHAVVVFGGVVIGIGHSDAIDEERLSNDLDFGIAR